MVYFNTATLKKYFIYIIKEPFVSVIVNVRTVNMCQAHFTSDSGKQGQICILRINFEKTLTSLKSNLSC